MENDVIIIGSYSDLVTIEERLILRVITNTWLEKSERLY